MLDVIAIIVLGVYIYLGFKKPAIALVTSPFIALALFITAEVESALVSHAAVVEAAVIGRTVERAGATANTAGLGRAATEVFGRGTAGGVFEIKFRCNRKRKTYFGKRSHC